MWTVTNFLLCSFVVVIAQDKVIFKPDNPSLRVKLGEQADLQCCCSISLSQKPPELTWVRCLPDSAPPFQGKEMCTQVSFSECVMSEKENPQSRRSCCGTLRFQSVHLNDTGLYRCSLNNSNPQFHSHGTYLQVYRSLEKSINLSENTKNKILTAEGILLFLCVVLPAATLMCKSNKMNELERKKMKKEEENIYQGLNLDDCCTTYDQIERSQVNGPYEDVCNIIEEEEEEIQLEKP